jgi:hypothetical protein
VVSSLRNEPVTVDFTAVPEVLQGMREQPWQLHPVPVNQPDLLEQIGKLISSLRNEPVTVDFTAGLEVLQEIRVQPSPVPDQSNILSRSGC